MDERSKRLIPDRLVWQRYGVSSMTGWRWDHDPTLNFPKPFRIKSRKYRAEDELDAFDQRIRSANEIGKRPGAHGVRGDEGIASSDEGE